MITRNTIRWDGSTVGDAIDREAAFLRSIGFNVPDGGKTFDEQEDDFVHEVRDAVLEALDTVAEKHGMGIKAGWKDGDLAVLFKGVDEQAKKLFWKKMGVL